MGNLGKKAGAIIKSRLIDLPVEQEWYQNRLKICGTCPYNSENVSQENKTLGQKLRELADDAINLCPQKRYCKACGCCIDQKAALKEMSCGLSEIGEKPLWDALEVEDPKDSRFVLSVDPSKGGKITQELGRLIIDFGDVSEEVIDFSFGVFAPKPLKYVATIGTCGCTVAETEVIDGNNIKVSGRVSTKNFLQDSITTKSVQVEYDKQRYMVYLRLKKVAKP